MKAENSIVSRINRTNWKLLLATGTLCLSGAVSRAQVSSADFLPVAQGGTEEVAKPAEIKEQGKNVTGATAQDAINYAVTRNTKALADGGSPEVGARMVSFPSGMGFVATGASTYRTMDNPTATRIAKRQAYVIAFIQAKKSLAEILNGLSNEGRDTVRQSLQHVSLPKEDLTNLSTESSESLTQVVQMMLRGFVIYEVKDDAATHTVFVSIVTTPKTRGQLARPAPNVIETDDLRAGLEQIISEVKSGIVPPVGGRIIEMRKTGETAFVGFGSAVIASDANAAVQARLSLDSQKIAAMRAKDALCGLIIGDQTEWSGGVRESMKDSVREFEQLQAGDPLAKDNEAGIKKLDQARQVFLSKTESTDLFTSARKGILPPGINSKTWFDEDHAWAYGMAVYVPSLTKAATDAKTQMEQADPLHPAGTRGTGAGGGTSSGFTDEHNPNVPRPAPTTRPAPTGVIPSSVPE